MKYRVALDDGTIVAETPEEGVEFCVKDGITFLVPMIVPFRCIMQIS